MAVKPNGLIEDKNGEGIAIADLLHHPTLGLVSHQPKGLGRQYPTGGKIRVFTDDGREHWVDPDELEQSGCSQPEADEYWDKFNVSDPSPGDKDEYTGEALCLLPPSASDSLPRVITDYDENTQEATIDDDESEYHLRVQDYVPLFLDLPIAGRAEVLGAVLQMAMNHPEETTSKFLFDTLREQKVLEQKPPSDPPPSDPEQAYPTYAAMGYRKPSSDPPHKPAEPENRRIQEGSIPTETSDISSPNFRARLRSLPRRNIAYAVMAMILAALLLIAF